MSEQVKCPSCGRDDDMVDAFLNDGTKVQGVTRCASCKYVWRTGPDIGPAVTDAEPFDTVEGFGVGGYPVPRGYIAVNDLGYISVSAANEIKFYGWAADKSRLMVSVTHDDIGWDIPTDADPGCPIALAKLGAEIARAQGPVLAPGWLPVSIEKLMSGQSSIMASLPKMTERIEGRLREVFNVSGEVAALARRVKATCSYCNTPLHEVGDTGTPADHASVMGHVQSCPENPLVQQLSTKDAELAALRERYATVEALVLARAARADEWDFTKWKQDVVCAVENI